MTAKTLDEIMKRVLNDPDIFYVGYPIFDEAEWKNLGEEFQKCNFTELTGATTKIDEKINQLKEKINQLKADLNSERNRRKKERLERAIELTKKAIELTEALKSAVKNKPHILGQMFLTLDRFGLVKCNLPNMEDFGKVIENHNRSTVEQYFLYKIGKEGDKFRKKALKKTLEYLKELYAMKLDTLEIAFFIRKLGSLAQFMEVIKDE